MAFNFKKLLTHVLLPLPIFSFLAFSALRLLILRQSLVENGLQSHIYGVCWHSDLAPHPYRLQYTGLSIAEILYAMVVFFHALMDKVYYPLLAVLFPAIGMIALIPLIEAARDRRPLVLGAPGTPVGVLFQLLSIGLIIPIYSLLFVVTGAASIRPSHTPNPPSKISPANAESLLFGLFVGCVLPTALVLHHVASLTALSQGIAFLFALATIAYRFLFLPSLPNNHSGHPSVMAALAFTFFCSALFHALYVWPLFPDIEALRTLFVPINIANVINPATVSLSNIAHEFIKWDIVFAMGSMMLATLWMADGVLCFVGILVWHGIATIAFGPAAAIAGVFMWRERRLNGQSHALPKKTGSRKTECWCRGRIGQRWSILCSD